MLRAKSSKPLQLTLGYVYLFSYGEVPYSLHSETLLDSSSTNKSFKPCVWAYKALAGFEPATSALRTEVLTT